MAEPIEESLSAAELAVEQGRGLAGTGFWGAVDAVKRERSLVDVYGERIAVVDRRAFENWALLTVPIVPGTAAMVLATALGIFLIGLAYAVSGDLLAVVVFYVGLGVLLVSTHGLAHLAVGWATGMKFTHWFIGKIIQPQPGVKVDYATYLRASASQRAWMHASGAILTKALPFLLIGAAVAAGLPTWAVWLLVVVGVGLALVDAVWSTKKSDWKKFRREMDLAQGP